MKKIRKPILLAIALAIAGLMITSAASLPTNVALDGIGLGDPLPVERNKATVVTVDAAPQRLSLQQEEVTIPPSPRPAVVGGPAFVFPGDQLHPAFARADGGIIMAAYYDEDLDSIIWAGSNDDGATFLDGVYWDIGGDYPAIKLWNDTRFFGTFVTDYVDANGGACYRFESTDPMDTETYSLVYWDFSSYGWYDMIDADIACNNQQDIWEWGAHSFVISTTYDEGYTDGPTILFADPDEEGSAYISWYYVDGCAHCDVDIDPVTQLMYAVYDWYNTTSGKWELLVRVLDMTDPLGTNDWLYSIPGTGNLQYPAVAAYDDNLYILAETDENGNKDIICYYSDEGMPNLLTEFVVNTGDDERYPDIRHVEGTTFAATFVKEDNLYATMTGGSWEDPWQINDNDDVVVEEYKTSDLCENAVKAMWEETHDDIDIYIGNVIPNDPPTAPDIEGPTSGKAGTAYDYDFTATDPDGNDVKYYIDWGDDSTEWTSFAASGTPVTVSHTWDEQGDYTITAKAQDTGGLTGPEATLPITMPKARFVHNSLFLRLLERFPNAFPILQYLFDL